MPSEKKKRKLKNSHGCRSVLKNKESEGYSMKRYLFYTPSDRQINKKIPDEAK